MFSERLKEDRLQRKSFTTVEELEKYSEATTGTLWLLSLASLGVKDVNADTAAKHAARCIGKESQRESIKSKMWDFRFGQFDTCSAYCSITRDSYSTRLLLQA